MEPRHEKIAKIALGAAGDRGLALAGGYAVGAHGMGHRPSGDGCFTPDDAVANKMCALFGRAMPRDFLDVDAAIMSGAYTQERLLELATAADGGFDPVMFAHALGALTQITDDAFGEYGVPAEQIAAMRQRFAHWREHLAAQA